MQARPNKKKSFGEFFKGFDYLGEFKTFMIKGSKSYQTTYGACLTIFLTLLTVGYSSFLLE